MREPGSEKDLWWAAPDGQPSNGSPNYEMDERCACLGPYLQLCSRHPIMTYDEVCAYFSPCLQRYSVPPLWTLPALMLCRQA